MIQSIIRLSDILQDFEESTKLLSDPNIQLYEEHRSFEQHFEDLRCYFENIVQSRRRSCNDSKNRTNRYLSKNLTHSLVCRDKKKNNKFDDLFIYFYCFIVFFLKKSQ